ncbi:MAG: DNA polymerase III subunit beta, partial [Malacoplasma sp.]|nr:DNA polymerase III subunit beta [Malacoplasma sp.]
SILLEKIDNSILKIKTETIDSNINLLDDEQYPIISFIYEGWEEIQLSPTIFKNIQTKIIQSVSQNKEKISVLNGVLISVKDKNMEIVGSDSYRLSYLLFKCSNSNFNVIIDSYILTILADVVDHSNNINLYISENNIIIKFKNYTFSTKVIEGDYPNISNIIKSPRLNSCLINKKELAEALERGMTIAATERKPIAKLNFSESQLNIVFKNIDLGNSEEKISVEKYEGKEMTISVNAFFLISLLKAVENDYVTISTSDENKPIIITDEKEQNFIQLLLPVRNI